MGSKIECSIKKVNFFRSFWYLHCCRNAVKRLNIFCRKPTTIDMQIVRSRQILDGYNSPDDKQTVRFQLTVFVCDDCMVMPRDRNNILTQYFHRLRLDRISTILPFDSIYQEYYRTKFLSVCWISLRLE